MGTYEPRQTSLFSRSVHAGDVVIDIGANAGYYTLLAARSVGLRGRVIACEPDPKIASFLRRHVAINKLTNVVVEEAAADDRNGVARFRRGRGTGTGRVDTGGELEVQARTLDDIVREHHVVPTHIKIDVEGAELNVLRGGQSTLAHARPTIFLSTHGQQVHEACCLFLKEYGYQLTPIDGGDVTTAAELLAAA
jgi:FkbM family methyltransferase